MLTDTTTPTFTEAQLAQLREVMSSCLTQAQSPWMDCSKAADYAGCSLEMIRIAVNAGHLKRHHSATNTQRPLARYHKDDLDAWLRGKERRRA